ncbi:Hsp20/alpha crystallin family protein [Azohydromonas caseinilytica]|uniref:Hsp20/alpha crystallin family protein n=1 Tax=Azohydromonas caseinilytica TaxID=2728836 RepID=A0A848FH71_9BURK|nr:Hsp20/alpha crystallin family protein [Azohydromonas caseinilytica]NML17603.1 Hsp20/alpha crystallin family protein [Azohydromonas caseinilytica]
MFGSLLNFPGGVFSDFDRLRRELDDVFGPVGQPSNIRSMAPGSFPAINVGRTPQSVEIYAFAPGLDPAKLEVNLDRGVLTISGERASTLPEGEDKKQRVYSRERVSGRFMRAISLPDDIDPSKVQARYRDGVLNVSVGRRAEAQPQRIQVQ